MGFTVGMCLERWEIGYVKVWWLWVELRFADWCIAVMHGYSTERSESYAADTQQTATLDLKHRRRHNPTSPTPTYDSSAAGGAYSPDVVALLTYSAASYVNSVTELFRISKKNVSFIVLGVVLSQCCIMFRIFISTYCSRVTCVSLCILSIPTFLRRWWKTCLFLPSTSVLLTHLCIPGPQGLYICVCYWSQSAR